MRALSYKVDKITSCLGAKNRVEKVISMVFRGD